MQYDVYRLRDRGLVVDVQSDFAPFKATRVAVPLLPPDPPSRLSDITPQLAFEGEEYLLGTQLISAVLTKDLGKAVGSMADHRDAITRALDLLFTGF